MENHNYKPSNTLFRSDVLAQMILEEILSQGGRISFARFMQQALYAPNLGYYTSQSEKIGELGDFITAPHISPLFARAIAEQFKIILADIPKGDILEIGAGSGLFAVTVLQALEDQGMLPEHYFIYEISPNLRKRQQNVLQQSCPHLLTRVEWLDQLPIKKINGIIFANEVLDALPVHIFRMNKGALTECFVTFENNQFASAYAAPTLALAEAFHSRLNEYILPDGFESELSMAVPAFIESLCDSLAKGVVLLFDYGYGRAEYYHPDRSMGTFMCYYQHQKTSNPYSRIGLQDMTAHVDFTSVIETAVNCGCELAGFTTQAAFLLSCGLLNLSEQNDLSLKDKVNQTQAIKKLIMPTQMGESIKVMGLTKHFSKPLLGFSEHGRIQDL